MHNLLISALIAGLITCGTALAQATPDNSAPPAVSASGKTGGPRHGQRPPKLDKNGDGFVSREEAVGHKMLEKNFDAIDTNKDGKLSKDERRAFHEGKREQLKEKKAEFDAKFKAADKNGDGALTKQEAETGKMGMIAKRFDQIDANHDGKVTPEELGAARKDMHGKRRPAGGNDGLQPGVR